MEEYYDFIFYSDEREKDILIDFSPPKKFSSLKEAEEHLETIIVKGKFIRLYSLGMALYYPINQIHHIRICPRSFFISTHPQGTGNEFHG